MADASMSTGLHETQGAATRRGAAWGFDPDVIRKEFPILFQTVRDGKPLVYLDSAATTQKPVEVIEALNRYYREINANVHRAIHRLAELATASYEEARTKIARFLHAPGERSIIYTRGTTESINLVAYSWGRKFIAAGDEIVLTEMEHHSNLIPWQLLAQQTGAKLKFIPVREDGTLDMDAYARLLSPRVKLVAFAHVSNVLGTVNPAREIVAAARRAGAVTLVDAAQSAPNMPVDVQALGCDFLAFSGHKMCGPTGFGVLYAREDLQEAMEPFHGGGEMISKVFFDHATWAEIPHKFEAGTPDISGAIGLGVAIDYLERIGMPAIHAYEKDLTAYAMRRLRDIDGLRIHGTAEDHGGAISFELAGIHPHDVAHFVDQDGIAIRAGHMCAQPLMRKRGVSALSRASLYFYNVRDDIDRLVESLQRVKGFFDRAA
jgi:cysteine desulfurase / selenocysteine lyase